VRQQDPPLTYKDAVQGVQKAWSRIRRRTSTNKDDHPNSSTEADKPPTIHESDEEDRENKLLKVHTEGFTYHSNEPKIDVVGFYVKKARSGGVKADEDRQHDHESFRTELWRGAPKATIDNDEDEGEDDVKEEVKDVEDDDDEDLLELDNKCTLAAGVEVVERFDGSRSSRKLCNPVVPDPIPRS